MIDNIKRWFRSIKWKKVLLSDTFILSYPFAVLASIALLSSNIFVTLAWIIWVVVVILAITNDK